MLLDLLTALLTPAPLAHRQLGCVTDSIRTGSRARRCRKAWAPHCEATKAVIRGAIAACPQRRKAVVLGSGYCDDVPLEELAAAFDRVVLVDAVHPLGLRQRARAHPQVELLTADLSGSFALLTGRANALAPPLPPVCAQLGTDLVISVNLLSQLPIRPVERLERSRRGLGPWRPEDCDRFGRAIIAGHLAALARLTARICLVTDLDETEEDRDGRVHEHVDLLYGIDPGRPQQSWTWELAPFGETGRGRRLLHRVAAYPDWRP